MPDTKRRTTTSTAVKRRYNDKTYTQFRAPMRNEDYADIDAFIQSKGWSKSEFIKAAYAILSRKMTVYYAFTDAETAHIITQIGDTAWDFVASLLPQDLCDIHDIDNKGSFLAMARRWAESDTLRDEFNNAPEEEKFPASEILTRFPDAKALI